jgi:hypothetical protein
MRRFKQSRSRAKHQFRRSVRPVRRVNYTYGARGGIHV